MRSLKWVSCLLVISSLFAQRSARAVERQYYLGYYQALADDAIDPEILSPSLLLYYASSYYQVGEKKLAYSLYQKAFQTLDMNKVEHPFLVEYGRLNLESENADLAIECFNQALTQVRSRDSIELIHLYLSYAQHLKKAEDPEPTDFRWRVYNLDELNTPEHEYSLYIHKGKIYFITRWDPGRGRDPIDFLPYEALYWKKNISQKPEHIGFFSEKHEGIAGFVKDTLIVYRSARRRGDFYIALPKGEGWEQPVFWKEFPNSRRGSEHAIWQDPKTGDIIFSSDRQGTKGSKDLWITRRLPDGKFSEPQNLETLNTPHNEDAPFITGDSLFFSHDGPSSIGGYDIFYSVRQSNGQWGPPRRLPRPFNSPAHDSYIYFHTPDSVYLSSMRSGGKGKMDLYLIVKEPISPPSPPASPTRIYTFSGKAYDKNTKQPLSVKVFLYPLESDSVIALISDKNGSFAQPKPAGGKYLLRASCQGYAEFIKLIVLPDSSDAEEEIPMFSSAALSEIRFPRINFDFDKYHLRPEGPSKIDTVVRLLNEYPTLIVEIAGHTDSIGTNAYNQRLSERRAHTVYRHLIERGIPAYRLKPVGYGEERPARPNDSPYHRFINRRVEFGILVEKTE